MQRDIAAGGVAGLIAGLVLALAGLSFEGNGLLDLQLSGTSLLVHIAVSIPIGGLFGAVFRYQPGAYSATISNGLLFALLLWIVRPLTLTPLVTGEPTTWSAMEAHGAFSTLIGHLLFGGFTGFGLFVIVTLLVRVRPMAVPTTEKEQRKRVVILGGGFGGVSTAQELEHLFRRGRDVEVTLVSQSNYLLFTPMLAEVAGSALESQHISSPVRASLPQTQFYRADVERLDTDSRQVRIRAGSFSEPVTLDYDHLVLSLGSVPNFFDLPGMEEGAFTLKTLEDATRLRNHVISLLEQADVNDDEEERRRQLTFVVAGGGFAGTETIAELFDLVHSALRYYPNIRRDELRFVLIHSRDRILPEIGGKLAEYALRKLEARGIEFMLGTRVGGCTATGVIVNEDEEVPARTVVWTAGNQPNPMLKTNPFELTRSGAVVAESTLQVRGFTNVWVVGDCGYIPDPDSEGQAYPPTAQHAIREGKMAAKNIKASLGGSGAKPFRFRTLGMLVPLGHRTGVAEIRGLRFSGMLAWLMWRVIYLGLLPGMEKKVRVSFDWVFDLFFPRDIVLTADVNSAPDHDSIADDGDRP